MAKKRAVKRKPAKKRVAKKKPVKRKVAKKRVVRKKTRYTKQKFVLVIHNFLTFLVLFILSLVLLKIFPGMLFLLTSFILGFILLAFLLVLLIFLFLRLFNK